MRYSWLVVLLCATLAAAQGAPASAPQQPAGPAPASAAVAPDAPVITIEGYCAATESGKVQLQNALAPPCRMVITREQFERLARIVDPRVTPSQMTRFAHVYAQYLVASNDAIKLGLDKSPDLAPLMDLMRLQALNIILQDHYLAESQKVSDAELQSYYNDNVAQFEEVQIERLYLPKVVNGQRQDEAALKARAEALRGRAAAGEAFETLQKEAWGTNDQAPPPTKIGPRRRSPTPNPLEEQIFALKVGEISPVLDEGAGYYIIRMAGRRTLPFAEVKDQIYKDLENKKFSDLMKAILELKPVLNPSYFATPAPAPQQ